MGRSTICCHQLAALDCQRCEKVRFVATSLRSSIVKDGKKYDFVANSLCWIVEDGRKYDFLPPVCARLSKMGESTICCHQFVLDCQRCEKVRLEEVRFVATSLCSIVKDGKKYDLLPPDCARLSKMGKSTICCHQLAALDCQRWEKVRFVAASLCSSVKDGKMYDLLPPVCARLSKMGKSTICCHQFVLRGGKKNDLLPPVCARLSKMGGSTIWCHQFVLDCQRWEEVRFVATSLCSIVKDGRKYDLLPPVCARLSKMGGSTILCHQFVLDCQRWEEVRFVATRLCSIVEDGKKYDLLPSVCGARLSKMGRSTVCCHQLAVLDCQRWQKVRFVATSLCSIVKDGRKYDLLPPVCPRRWEEVRFVQFVLKDGKKYGLLPPVCGALLSKMGGSTICCHQFVLECQRWENERFVATSLRCSLVKDGKKYGLLPPVCARLPNMGGSTICCHQFVLECQRWEKVRFVATSLCSSFKDGKKYDLLPPVCARLSKMGRSSILLPTVCARLSKMGGSTI